MTTLNRSAITIKPKQPFVDWANKVIPELPTELNVLGESKTYLTNPDFDNAEKHIKKYFKQIFEEELEGTWLNENDWPINRDFKTFCEWFDFEISDLVTDLSKKRLIEDF